jgi:hypothetical protein
VPDGPDKQVLNAAIWWSIKGRHADARAPVGVRRPR